MVVVLNLVQEQFKAGDIGRYGRIGIQLDYGAVGQEEGNGRCRAFFYRVQVGDGPAKVIENLAEVMAGGALGHPGPKQLHQPFATVPLLFNHQIDQKGLDFIGPKSGYELVI
jgi:hypothetical protein